jgi:tetratricopeptide (TPR) repeat protein
MIRYVALAAVLAAPLPVTAQTAGLDCARASAADRTAYEAALRQGGADNLARRFSESEAAYRQAVTLQQRGCGRDDPAQAYALSHVALQQSNLGRFAEAEASFGRVDGFLPAVDALVRARVLHNRALHAANRKAYPEALAAAERAEKAYLEAAPGLRDLSTQPRLRSADFDRGQPPAPRPGTEALDAGSRVVALSLAELYRSSARWAAAAGDRTRADLDARRSDAVRAEVTRAP